MAQRKQAAEAAPRARPRRVAASAKAVPADAAAHAARIDRRVAGLADWRGATLQRVRELVRKADPEAVEEVKWVKPTNPHGVAVWSHDGILCTGEVYKDKVKVTFAQGASLDDPHAVFNASLDAGTRRAIDIREGDALDAKAFQALVRGAVAFNQAKAAERKAR
ncbi:MAG TPA: DUF1801 domain-containing protein [Candidatus Thermoplasmatota archaeon]|nr:DUF1801 domain-containing protein [Candidatus Thermoplasmatota archaeon]